MIDWTYLNALRAVASLNTCSASVGAYGEAIRRYAPYTQDIKECYMLMSHAKHYAELVARIESERVA